jgi:hypothetical protein
MSHVVGIGYLGSIEALCDRLQVDEGDLEETLEESGLILFGLEDGQCFVTLEEKHQLVKDCHIVLDERTIYTPTELRLIKEYTGSVDTRIRICRLEEPIPEEVDPILELLKKVGVDGSSPQFEDAEPEAAQ